MIKLNTKVSKWKHRDTRTEGVSVSDSRLVLTGSSAFFAASLFNLPPTRMKAFCAMMLLSAGVSTMLLSVVQGVPMFTTRMPNGENVPHTRALGHEDGTGERDARNIFGIAFEEAGTKWTKELCEADSDEDGQTNGQELGDPCCIWKEGDEPLWTKGVSHPGVATQTSNKALWSNIDCVALQTQATVSKTKASTHEPEDDPDDSLLTVENLYRLEDSETEISTGTSTASSISARSALATVVVSFAALVAW